MRILQLRALVKPDFFIGLFFPFAYPGVYTELEGFVGSDRAFRGKICDLGLSYGPDRCDPIALVKETGMTWVASL